jgi:flagellar hook-length control protein FliK
VQTSAQAQAPASITLTTAHAMQAQHAVLEHGAAAAAPAATQVAREIVRRFDGENTRFELRLDPPELGRVDVRLDVSRDHRVTAMVTADSPQALTELARHARELTQSLQSAGLELADNGLSFDLRQSKGESQRADGEAGARGDETAGAAEVDAPIVRRSMVIERWRGLRIDMMV